MNMPSHHQSEFFQAVRNQGVDLKVCYYGEVDIRRTNMGWDGDVMPLDGELFYSPDCDSLELISDWRDRVHIVPGYGSSFLRKLVRKLSSAGVQWAHWSEASYQGLRWYLTYPIKRWHAGMVNKHAIGAFGCGNQALFDFLRWGIKREKIALLPYSPKSFPVVSSGKLELLRESIQSRNIFLYVGRLENQKGIDVLLRAFAAISTMHKAKDWILALVGNDVSNGDYVRIAKKLGIAQSVYFVGTVPVREIAAMHMVADVLVFPTRHDGWGAVVSESAACGKALIVSDQCGAAPHLVDPGINGFVVNSGDWRALANAMGVYVASPELAARHGKASSLIYERFTPQNNAKRFVEILHSWLARTNSESAQ
jgi:glycosyltransferase involved in cell wall biosynthesis